MAQLRMGALTHKAIADVTRRKGRTILVVLGILISVLGLTAINVANDTLFAAFRYSSTESQSPDITYSVSHLDASVVAKLVKQPNVASIETRTFFSTRWQIEATPGHVVLAIVGYKDLRRITFNPFQLTSGRLPGAGEIVMESSDVGLQYFSLGDSVTVETPNGPQHLTIVGISRTVGLSSATLASRAYAYMSAEDLSKISGLNSANNIQIKVRNTAQVKQTVKDIDAFLVANHVTVLSSNLVESAYDPSIIDGLFTVTRVLAAIALLLASFLVINTVTTLVAEQTKIIGTMKAIGGSRWAIIRTYLLSVTCYALIGTVIGIVLGIWGGYQLTHFLASLVILDLGPFSLSPGILAISVVVGIGVPLLAAIVPLWIGTSLTVRDAMAAYGVRNDHGARIKRRSSSTWVSHTTLLGIRGLFRKRGRAILTVLALTCSGTAFLTIQTTTYSVNSHLSQLFRQYDYDVIVNIDPQPYTQVSEQIRSISNVARIERLEQMSTKSLWGNVLLTGIESDSQIYHTQLISGRALEPGEADALLISELVAQKTGLRVGDTVTLSTATHDQTWHIVGEVHDLYGRLGVVGVVLTTIGNMHLFSGLPSDLAVSVMIQAQDRSPLAVDQLANHLDDALNRAGFNPRVVTAMQNLKRIQTEFQVLYLMLYIVTAIVALVGVLGLLNTLTTSVLERRREIGILRSMGATGGRVAYVFGVEGLSLALIGWGVGGILGIPAAYAFVTLLSNVLIAVPFAFDPMVLVVMLGFMLIIATLASIGPALGASRIRIAETLRYE